MSVRTLVKSIQNIMRQDTGVDGDAQRIVARVDELMVLCNRFESSLAAADTTRHHFLESLLQDVLEPAADQFATVRRDLARISHRLS